MFIHPKIDQSNYPNVRKFLGKIFYKKVIIKPDKIDIIISKQIIDFYSKLKKKYNHKSEWTWINKKKRSNFISHLEKKNYFELSKLLANCFKNNISYGIISWDWHKLKNLKNKKNFISSILKDNSSLFDFNNLRAIFKESIFSIFKTIWFFRRSHHY